MGIIFAGFMGSTTGVDGFIAHCLSFCIEETTLDIRPLPYILPGLHFIQTDASLLFSIEDNTIESLSSLQVLVYFGLLAGGWGNINSYACSKAMCAIEGCLQWWW